MKTLPLATLLLAPTLLFAVEIDSTPVRNASLRLVREQVKPDPVAMAEAAQRDSEAEENTVALPDFTIMEGFKERELLEIVNGQLRFNESKELAWDHGGYYYSQPFGHTEMQLGVWASYDQGNTIGNRGMFRVPHVKLVSVNW